MLNKILSFSPGTQYFGIALFHGNQLIDWKIETFHNKWSAHKLKAILKCIEQWLFLHDVNSVAIKIPDELPRSAAFIQLIGSLNNLLNRKGIYVAYYTQSDLKFHFCGDRTVSKSILNGRIAEKFSALSPEYDLEMRNRNLYYHRVFEAIAAGYVLQSTIE